MGEETIAIETTRRQAHTILESLKFRASMTRPGSCCHEDSMETYNIVKRQIESQ